MSVFAKIACKRKDGEPVTYTDYKGNEQTKATAPLCTVFENDDRPGMYSVKFEKGAEIYLGADSDEYWFNMYLNDGGRSEERAERNKRTAAAAATKRSPARPAPACDDGGGDDIPF